MTLTSFDDLAVGDEVWCLAAIGTPFLVAGLDHERRRVTVSTHPAGGGDRVLDFPVGLDVAAHQREMGPTVVLARPRR